MTTIQSITRFKIHAGKSEEFKRIAAECLRLTHEKDPGTLRYEMFLNADETECILHGEYADLAALHAHFRNMGENVQAIGQIADAEHQMWGDPGNMRDAIQANGCRIYAPFLSLNQ